MIQHVISLSRGPFLEVMQTFLVPFVKRDGEIKVVRSNLYVAGEDHSQVNAHDQQVGF
jgi:hypothetical protein